MNVGIEMEFWVVDEFGRLCDGRHLAEAHERACPEFVGPLVEVETAPHERPSALRRDLAETLRAVLRAADESGLRLVPLGTPLTAVDAPARDPRGELFEEIYGAGIRSAKNCAGTHVHVDQHGSEEGVTRQLNLLTALDPALALVSSSPYYCGERTVNCARAQAYRTACGEPFQRFCDLWPYVESTREWEARVDAAFETFLDLAVARGITEERVRSHFEAEDALLNPVRLRGSPATVEWRAPDTTLPSQAVRLAFDVADLVEETRTKPVVESADGFGPCEDCIRVPERAALDDLRRAAIRWGPDYAPVRSYLDAMGFERGRYRPLSRRLDGRRTIDEAQASEIRLRYADRLREDVATLSSTGPSLPVRRPHPVRGAPRSPTWVR